MKNLKTSFPGLFMEGNALITGCSKLDGKGKTSIEALMNIQPYVIQRQAGEGFPQSVVSGDPSSDGVILWTRVDDALESGLSDKILNDELPFWMEGKIGGNQLSLNESIPKGHFLMFEVSREISFSTISLSGFAPIWKDHDHIVRLDLSGYLDSATVYYYRFVSSKGYQSRIGRFKTLPSEYSDVAACRLGCISCQDYTNGYFKALDYLADEEIDFFIHLGDYIYESVGESIYQGKLDSRKIILPDGKSKAETLEDYRILYKKYRQDKNLQRLHECHAMAAIWDDHEFTNDTYSIGGVPDIGMKDPVRREAANLAWLEYMPARVTVEPMKTLGDGLRLYRSIKLGKLAILIMTDERLYRSSHPCGEEKKDRYMAKDCDERTSSNRTMLGEYQLNWFLNELKHSDQTWKLWGNEVQLAQMKLLGRYVSLDAWDGYAYERELIAKMVLDEKIKNLLVLSGDFHTFEASVLEASHHFFEEKKAYGIELMTGSVTSSNLREAMRNEINKIPDFSSPLVPDALEKMIALIRQNLANASTTTTEILFKELQNVIKLENPWIKFFDITSHGYSILDLDKEHAVWKSYKINRIESEDAEKELLFECEIPAGKAELSVKDGSRVR